MKDFCKMQLELNRVLRSKTFNKVIPLIEIKENRFHKHYKPKNGCKNPVFI